MVTWTNRQLLCTFCNLKNLDNTIELIKRSYDNFSGKMFVFSNTKNRDELYITYNTEKGNKKILNTILIHRKKEYNVLYTINSLNQLIRDENQGVLDKNYIVQWELYRDSLIINGEISIKIISLNLEKICVS